MIIRVKKFVDTIKKKSKKMRTTSIMLRIHFNLKFINTKISSHKFFIKSS